MDKDREDENALWKLIRSEDQIGAVIRAHLWVEARLTEILERNTGRDWSTTRFTYNQKVWLACALGIVPGNLEEALKMLGQFRNNMAHRIGASIADTQQGEFLNAIPDKYRTKLAEILSELPAEGEKNSNLHLKGLKGRRAVSLKFAAGIFALLLALWKILDELEDAEVEHELFDLEGSDSDKLLDE